MTQVRQPAVAGSFYARRADALGESLRQCFLHKFGPGRLPEVNAEGRGRVLALVSPHAGYMYSGPAAANGYAALAADGVPESVIILGPSHYASGRGAAISAATIWRTPLGDVAVDQDLCRQLLEATEVVQADEWVHASEHSLEVQVPFLQFAYGDRVPRIVPVCVRSHPFGDVGELAAEARHLGETIASAVGDRRVVVIASSDFSHQVPQDFAVEQDRRALDAICAMDPGRLLDVVAKHRISTCGPVPVAIAVFFCLARGGGAAELLRYYTSGDIIGDKSAVVGYASVVIRRDGGAAR